MPGYEGEIKHAAGKSVPLLPQDLTWQDYDFLEQIICNNTEFNFDQVANYDMVEDKEAW